MNVFGTQRLTVLFQLMESLGTVESFFDAESDAGNSVELVEWMREELGVLGEGADAE